MGNVGGCAMLPDSTVTEKTNSMSEIRLKLREVLIFTRSPTRSPTLEI